MQSAATQCKYPSNWFDMYVVKIGGKWSQRYACILMRLFVVGNYIPVFVVQIDIRLAEGLFWLIVVPHTLVMFVDCSALIQCHMLIGGKLQHFRKACCFLTRNVIGIKSVHYVVFLFSQANFHMQ